MLLLAPTPLYAATQGVMGNTSSASAHISVSKSPRYELRGLQDMVTNQAISNMSQNICLYSTLPQYRINVDGDSGETLTLRDGSASLPYHAEWKTAGVNKPLSPGSDLIIINAQQNACQQAQLNIHLQQATQALATNARYGGALTLIIAPY